DGPGFVSHRTLQNTEFIVFSCHCGAFTLNVMKVVVTDLDGTLLDQDTYDWEPARSALERLRALGIPLVFCTTKTRAEVEHWRTITGNAHPFIVENGGAMYIPLGYFPFSVPFARQSETYEM